MRITGGSLRGREVGMPRRGQVRPTASRVREALFSVLGQDLSGWSALDAFAGAGLLGIEAASRGASPVLLCDRDPQVVRHLEAQLARLRDGLAEGVRLSVRRADAARLLAGEERWDLVLLDPPYADDPEAWLRSAAPHAREALVLEHRWGPELPDRVAGLRLDRHRRYGDTGLAVYLRAGPDEGGSQEDAPPAEG